MKELAFDLGDMTFRGKRWGQEGGTPVIALHGWLDNCATFDYVAPLLDGVDLLAIDLAGQGQSDHRIHSGAYNIWLDIAEVIAIADQLGWEKFGVLGHSRGAMISTLVAGTFPERVSHLALIESFVPQIVAAADAPDQLASAVNALLSINGKSRSEFPSFEAAVKARERGFLKLAHQDALVLAKRGVLAVNGKYCWNNDIKLNAPSEVKFTREQVEAFVDRITVPIHLIIAEDGLLKEFSEVEEFIEQNEQVQVVTLPGDHHLHMSQQCERVAQILNDAFS